MPNKSLLNKLYKKKIDVASRQLENSKILNLKCYYENIIEKDSKIANIGKTFQVGEATPKF